jgi:GNAT superfamily N-acetyltransferase
MAGQQVEPLGEVLGRAFFESPLHKYFIPDDGERRRFLPQFFLRVTRMGYLFGETYATPDSTGMAFWIRPGEILGDEQNERAGLNEIRALAGEEAFARVSIVFDALEGLHKEHATDDHWYLQLLGVDVPLQRRGIGSALMQPVLKKADADGVTCYMDTAEPRSLPFYRRHGFDVVVDMIEPSSGLRLWFLRREPRR